MQVCAKLLTALAILGATAAFAADDAGQEKAGSENARPGVMLVLGSSNSETRAARVALACSLLKGEKVAFDRIILSGGCGAHGTDIGNCEATDMQRLLRSECGDFLSGVAVSKEERSLSTIQNYCFSRRLKENGADLIRKGDRLYVVSSHHHALSIAACFRNDGMDAYYYYTCGGSFYEGAAPSLGTVASSTAACYQDYAGISQNCARQDWCDTQTPTCADNR